MDLAPIVQWIQRRSIADIKVLMSTVGVDINAATTTPKMEKSAAGVTLFFY